MNIDLVFRIAGIGIIVTVISQILNRAGREDIATLAALSGLVVVLMMVVRRIAALFDLVKDLFHF